MSDSEPGLTPESIVRRLGLYSWAFLGFIVLVGVLAWLGIQGRIILAPLLLAAVLVFVLNPVVVRLERRGLPRLVGTGIALGGVVVLLVVVGALVIPGVVDQARDFAGTFPRIFDDLVVLAEGFLHRLGLRQVYLWRYEDFANYLQDPGNRDFLVELFLSRIGEFTAGVLELFLVAVLGPVLAFYLLIDLPRLQERVLGLFPPASRAEVAFVGRSLNVAVGGFLKGQLLVAMIVGVMLAVGYRIIGLPFWLLIGMIGGVLNIVPFLGPWVGGALGVLVAVTTSDPLTALWAVVVAVVVQQIDNHFITPSVLRATVKLHPAMTLSVLVLAGAVAGVWGVVVAVPLTATLKVVVGHWWRTRVLGESWEEAREAVVEETQRRET
ncbi:MAG TPA: AI-2E family transporter [Actinobacteria bacterium]|nr:AI-2E family transporter [Actinomycetota bacterium]